QCAAGFNASITGTLRFEVIRGFSQWQPGGFREFRNRALRKFWMSVQTRAHRRAAKSQCPEVMTNTLQSRNSVLNLARVTAELLPQRQRRRILQMGATNFQNMSERFRFFGKFITKCFQ